MHRQTPDASRRVSPGGLLRRQRPDRQTCPLRRRSKLGIVLTIFLLLADVLGHVFIVAYCSSGGTLYLSARQGNLLVIWGKGLSNLVSEVRWASGDKRLGWLPEHGPYPRSLSFATRGHYVTAPLWIPLGLAYVITSILVWRDRHRFPVGHCVYCGYSLAGNVSGICPECGAAVPERQENRA